MSKSEVKERTATISQSASQNDAPPTRGKVPQASQSAGTHPAPKRSGPGGIGASGFAPIHRGESSAPNGAPASANAAQPAKTIYSCVRVTRIKNLQQLAVATQHAKRTGPNIVLRDGAEPGDAIAWSIHEEDPTDYVAAFKRQKEISGAREFGGAAISLHGIFIISPSWFAEAGDIHDRDNPRVQLVITMTRDMIEKEIGGLFALRFDLDELGSGVVDFFCAPTAERQRKPSKNGNRKPPAVEISVRKALKALQVREGERTEGAALQSMAARWCQDHLDERIQRGTRKALTGAQHMFNEVYRGWSENEHKAIAGEREEAAAEIDAARAALAEKAKAEKERLEDDRRQAEALLQLQRQQQEAALAAQRKRLAKEVAKLAAEREQFRVDVAMAGQQQAEVKRDIEAQRQELIVQEAAIAEKALQNDRTSQSVAGARRELEGSWEKLIAREGAASRHEEQNVAASRMVEDQREAVQKLRLEVNQQRDSVRAECARNEERAEAIRLREVEISQRETSISDFAAHCVTLAKNPHLASSKAGTDPDYDIRRARLSETHWAAASNAVAESFRNWADTIEGWRKRVFDAGKFLAETCRSIMRGEKGAIERMLHPCSPLASAGLREVGEYVAGNLERAVSDIETRNAGLAVREQQLVGSEREAKESRAAMKTLHEWLRVQSGGVPDDSKQPSRWESLIASPLAEIAKGASSAYDDLMERGRRTSWQLEVEAKRLRDETDKDRQRAAEMAALATKEVRLAQETARETLEFHKHLLQVFSEMPKSLQDRVSSKFKEGERVRAISRGIER